MPAAIQPHQYIKVNNNCKHTNTQGDDSSFREVEKHINTNTSVYIYDNPTVYHTDTLFERELYISVKFVVVLIQSLLLPDNTTVSDGVICDYNIITIFTCSASVWVPLISPFLIVIIHIMLSSSASPGSPSSPTAVSPSPPLPRHGVLHCDVIYPGTSLSSQSSSFSSPLVPSHNSNQWLPDAIIHAVQQGISSIPHKSHTRLSPSTPTPALKPILSPCVTPASPPSCVGGGGPSNGTSNTKNGSSLLDQECGGGSTNNHNHRCYESAHTGLENPSHSMATATSLCASPMECVGGGGGSMMVVRQNQSSNSHRVVIVAIDASPISKYSVKWTRRHVLKANDVVVLATICEEVSKEDTMNFRKDAGNLLIQSEDITDFNRSTLWKAQQLISSLYDAYLSELHVFPLIVPLNKQKKSLVGDIICRAAKQLNGEMIVVGENQGHSVMTNFFFGSVPKYIVDHSHCPVIVVKQ
eukprot:GHVQ01022866.1.p1 GENE.GHVQ01022866.1~~GHVQ01022866.1.p1  ORF type:complete len:469 (+),score=95.80 GHVQ01022866.1:107-1513(+)